MRSLVGYRFPNIAPPDGFRSACGVWASESSGQPRIEKSTVAGRVVRPVAERRVLATGRCGSCPNQRSPAGTQVRTTRLPPQLRLVPGGQPPGVMRRRRGTGPFPWRSPHSLWCVLAPAVPTPAKCSQRRAPPGCSSRTTRKTRWITVLPGIDFPMLTTSHRWPFASLFSTGPSAGWPSSREHWPTFELSARSSDRFCVPRTPRRPRRPPCPFATTWR